MALEIDTVIADARREWSHATQSGSLSVYDMIARAVLNYVEEKIYDQPRRLEPQGFKIWVPGAPAPWGMGRQVARGRRLKPQRLQDYQSRVLLEWRRIHGSTQLSGPVQLDFAFHTPSSSVDTSNMIKGAEDALKDQAFGDDDRVYRIGAVKIPVRDKPEAGTEICVSAYVGHSFSKHAEE